MQSAGWLFVAWTVGYPALVLAAAGAETWAGGWRVKTAGVDRACWIAFAALSAAIAAIAALVIGTPHRLPDELHGHRFTDWGRGAQLIAIALACAAILLLRKARVGRRALHAWVSLSLVAFISFNALVAFGGARYTIGWDLSRLSGFFASALLLAFFLRRFARLNRSLARANVRLREANENLERHVGERTAALDETNRELRRALDERGLLLREVLHRVRNNLQLIDSLVAIQVGAADSGGDDRAGGGLAALRRRINALGLLHQQQMRAEDLSHFDIRPFLDELARQAVAAHPGAGGPGPSGRDRWSKVITVEADPLTVDFDAGIGLGLLASELVSDALNRAGPDPADGAVRLLLRHGADGMLSLAVADDGASFEAEGARAAANVPAGGVAGGSGATIVAALVRQLDGTMTVRRANGTIVEVRMPTPRTAAR
jgi:two-component sensor histidine kinase